ncbi:MAG: phage major capsid protein [Solirubrobacterales bacterium]
MKDLYEKRSRLEAELDELKAKYEQTQDKGLLERMGNVKRGYDAVRKEIITELAKRPQNREAGVDEVLLAQPRRSNGADGTTRDAAQRAIESRSDVLDATSGDRLSNLIDRDTLGIDSEYVAAISDPAYERAFARTLGNPQGAGQLLSGEEHQAMLRVGRAMASRALAAGEGATGGYAVPIALDPTILLQNDGAINPIRELATVSTIATTVWKGVASEGVAFEFVAEAAEAEDGAPELAQPSITPERAQCWIPFSIEAGDDWSGLSGEMQRLLTDAKQVKEAEVFATGKGTENIPQGLVTGATGKVETAAEEAVALADIYSMQEALAPRYQPRATWLGTNKVANQIHKFVAVGDAEEAALMSDDRSSILGKAYREVSTMSSKTTTSEEKVLLYGDVASAYRIVDRVGMTVETVPHVFGENQRPTGQRGLFAYFRVGAKVINAGAVKALEVK